MGTLVRRWWECIIMGAASVANSWTVPQKWNIESPCDSAILILVRHSEELQAGIQTDTYTPMRVAALFTVTKGWKQPKCPLSDEWINKTQCTHTAQRYSPLKGTESLTPVMTSINLEDMPWWKQVRHRRINIVWLHLREVPREDKVTEKVKEEVE